MAEPKTTEAEGKSNPVPVQPGKPEQQTNTSAIKSQTGQPPLSKESAQVSVFEDVPFWTILWAILIVGVFVLLWTTGKIEAIKKYLHETREQLRKATWPTREELKQHIVVVMLSSLLLAVFTVIADQIVRELIWGALLRDPTTTLGGMMIQ
tara:strand:+ start:1594 stop:2046 length:453 start_codon:yes stop_codon:yes gene_type:complete